MPLINFISNQCDLLGAIADGGQAWCGESYYGKDEWWLRRSGKSNIRIFASTARAAVKRGYIEPTGALYYQLTDAGREYLRRLGEGRLS